MLPLKPHIGLLFFLCLAAVACTTPDRALKKIQFYGEAQGTYYSVIYFDEEGRVFQEEIDSVLAAFDQSVSMWVPTSIISRINSGDTTVVPDRWFKDVFIISKQVAAATDGAFDMTIGGLVKAWGFGPEGPSHLKPESIDQLLLLTGHGKVQLADGMIVKEDNRVQFDFNAVAQGYSVDLLANLLEAKGITDYLVDIGGEVFAKGFKPGEQPWVVGIEKPASESGDERVIQEKVQLTGKALATSGSYRKYYEVDGQRYSHTISPETGRPVTHSLLSVSVLASSCALADAYATAFMVMGTHKAMAFVEGRDDLEAYFINASSEHIFEVKMSPGFEQLILE